MSSLKFQTAIAKSERTNECRSDAFSLIGASLLLSDRTRGSLHSSATSAERDPPRALMGTDPPDPVLGWLLNDKRTFRNGNLAGSIETFLSCGNATDLAALALCSCSGVLRGCVSRLSGLAKNGTQKTDCHSSPPCTTFSADYMHRRITAMWPPAPRIALFQYTVCLCRALSIHPPASGSARHAAGLCNFQTRST